MLKKLTPEEIDQRREQADGYWITILNLEIEKEERKKQVKVLSAQIREAERYFAGLMHEITTGEVEVDNQMELLKGAK